MRKASEVLLVLIIHVAMFGGVWATSKPPRSGFQRINKTWIWMETRSVLIIMRIFMESQVQGLESQLDARFGRSGEARLGSRGAQI